MKWLLPNGETRFTASSVFILPKKIVTFDYRQFLHHPELGTHVWLWGVADRNNHPAHKNSDESLRSKDLILDDDFLLPIAVCKAKIRGDRFKLDFAQFKS